MNYEDASDAVINNKVKEILILNHASETDFDRFFLDALKRSNADYCSNPSVAWHIMVENGIAPLSENGRIYGATTDTYEYYEPHGNIIFSCEHKNPLRAAMIVYLEMNKDKK